MPAPNVQKMMGFASLYPSYGRAIQYAVTDPRHCERSQDRPQADRDRGGDAVGNCRVALEAHGQRRAAAINDSVISVSCRRAATKHFTRPTKPFLCFLENVLKSTSGNMAGS